MSKFIIGHIYKYVGETTNQYPHKKFYLIGIPTPKQNLVSLAVYWLNEANKVAGVGAVDLAPQDVNNWVDENG